MRRSSPGRFRKLARQGAGRRYLAPRPRRIEALSAGGAPPRASEPGLSPRPRRAAGRRRRCRSGGSLAPSRRRGRAQTWSRWCTGGPSAVRPARPAGRPASSIAREMTRDDSSSPEATRDHPRLTEITRDHPRSPDIARYRPISPEITRDHPRWPQGDPRPVWQLVIVRVAVVQEAAMLKQQPACALGRRRAAVPAARRRT